MFPEIKTKALALLAMLYPGKRIWHIIMHGNIEFACVVLGHGMVLWGLIGALHPSDLVWFASGFAFEVYPFVWAINHIAIGLGFIYVGTHYLPRWPCLLLGTYGAVVWTWIMMSRPSSSLSSGVTLNVIIVFMSMLIVQRSGHAR